ncbi:MAG TPA: DUF4350 domain-containing protein [Actinomycetaceae bacterium]|nr:DUF4350 domain-containing protein [Actinomycetaceae bacterium]
MTAFSAPPQARLAAAERDAPSPASRRRRTVIGLIVTAALVVGLIAAIVGTTTTSSTPLAPDNPQPRGAQAAARILQDEGVSIQRATTTARVVELSGPGTTVFLTRPDRITEEQLEQLRATGADLVIVDGLFAASLDALDDRIRVHPAGSEDLLHAECDDPHARAAQRIEGSRGAVEAVDASVSICFPTAEGAGALATWVEDGQRISYLAGSTLMTNAHLAEHGHAALTLRLLGQHEDLVWFEPSLYAADAGGDGQTAAASSLLPPQVRHLGWQLLIVVIVAIIFAGRRLGPVVTEDLPVVVNAAETVRGRGRLYRRSRSHGHAAAALRAGAARRLATTLGLPSSAGPTTLVPAVAAAAGREEQDVGRLLYGPPPHSENDLVHLSSQLDVLESEVSLT